MRNIVLWKVRVTVCNGEIPEILVVLLEGKE